MTRRRAAAALLGLGGLGFVGAVAWWWVVFGTIVGTQAMSLPQALPCLVADSDVCSLAQALCLKTDHWLGIRRYAVEAFWLSGLLVLLGVLAVPATASPSRPS